MIAEKINKHEIAEAQNLIREAQSVAILTHMSPDGDAIGSALGMKHYLEQLGKTLVAIVVPNRFPTFLAWMPDSENILIYEERQAECNTIIKEADLLVCLDFNNLKRIGKMGITAAESRAKKLLIDHHLAPQPFADVTISYPDMPSTCELLFRFICACGNFNLIDLPLAECLYTGMMTDTGNFSFNSCQADIYSIIAELVRIGVNKDAIYNKVFNTYSEDRMRLMGFCLYKKMRIFPELHTALITLSRQELYRFNFQSGDAEGLVNLPLQIADIHYSVFMREDKDKIKISFRSQGDRPVNEFAALFFNGGGHKNAAGGESYKSIEDTIAHFEQHFTQYFNR
ncbi:MAG: bifunctional oligoribonuclease/PAP phosphatase NrnA [Paludibacter sp.]|nr:bifunctional oligoribonuclease/PAP phosphatase NrnA [Bacteroidales bacterium]MCM1069739.1 bifunctional oligoribonuclease/PAP phosphatase NrnA [Prevotella sp.]MCM1354424.1 bifunctional oligoribonuclease/PAP phosphatase NrnA [Bacteroides sp.]MCM1443238.1 bifunctional oligoribonuclease/PAP phosphatase NrnA [Muribaculum sp.]MCM1482458.1 bifunctional oligoribonuclease/PAP phosphatase NrnA [Paludibacter sp.]